MDDKLKSDLYRDLLEIAGFAFDKAVLHGRNAEFYRGEVMERAIRLPEVVANIVLVPGSVWVVTPKSE
jgi:hypothetical protein